MKKCKLSVLVLLLPAIFQASTAIARDHFASEAPVNDKRWQRVSGQAVHYFPNTILHSSRETQAGKIERSTELTSQCVG